MNVLAFDLPLFPEQAGGQAVQVDYVFFAVLGLSALLCVGLFVAISFCLIRYRAKAQVNRTMSKRGEYLIEATWSIIPMLIFTALFVWGAVVFVQARTPPKDALNIYVVGLQWYWDIQHEDGPHEVAELHVPVDQPVRLIMTSQDVIHNFYIPSFRIQMDVLPGKYTIEWFRAVQLGRYRVFCNQYCGTKHGEMLAWVNVMKPEDYQAWLTGQNSNHESVVAAGARLFRANNCSSCHGENPQVSAPHLEGIYGRQVALSDGTFVKADDDYIRDSILLPTSQVVAGYQPIMPAYQGQINESDLIAIIAYLKSLSPPAAVTTTKSLPGDTQP